MPLYRTVVVRRQVICEACGAKVDLLDTVCAYCGSIFEPISDDPNRLPSCKTSAYASTDAKLLKCHLDKFADLDDFWHDNVDDLIANLRVIRGHNYPLGDYIMELMILVGHFRSVCLDHTKEKRDIYLDVYKKLEAIYASLTT